MLTRRNQLAMAAKIKEENENKKGRGRGGGRGRGRGRQGKKDPKPEKGNNVHPEEVPEKTTGVTGLEDAATSTKRPQMCTPERRRLFVEEGGSPKNEEVMPPEVPGMSTSPPIKQPAKRSKGAAKAKAKSKAVVESKVEEKTEQPKGAGKGCPPNEVENKDDKNEKTKRPPTKNQVDWAKKELTDAKTSDQAQWDHALKLFEAVKVPERSCVEKYMYWSLSMYWTTRRVGLLQKQCGGAPKHVLSFGGGHCSHIGIPFEAARLYVGFSIVSTAVPKCL